MKKIFITIIVLALIAMGLFYLIEDKYNSISIDLDAVSEEVVQEEEKPVEVNEVEAILSRADFQRKVRLEAERIALEEKKESITQEFNSRIADIESRLEEIRGEELSFQ